LNSGEKIIDEGTANLDCPLALSSDIFFSKRLIPATTIVRRFMIELMRWRPSRNRGSDPLPDTY
jgi:hypothetical protein